MGVVLDQPGASSAGLGLAEELGSLREWKEALCAYSVGSSSANVAGAEAGKVGKGLEVHLRILGLMSWVVGSHCTVLSRV